VVLGVPGTGGVTGLSGTGSFCGAGVGGGSRTGAGGSSEGSGSAKKVFRAVMDVGFMLSMIVFVLVLVPFSQKGTNERRATAVARRLHQV